MNKITLADLAAAKAFIEAVRPVVLKTCSPEMGPAWNAYMELYSFRHAVDQILAEHSVEVES